MIDQQFNGCDSAFGPNPGQLAQAKDAGASWWGWYAYGEGSYHVWSDDEVNVLSAGGILTSLPICVPRLDLTNDPVAEAEGTIVRAKNLGWNGVVALDTEASMRGNPRLVQYVTTWCESVAYVGWTPVVYGGGNFVPQGVAAWWIIPGGFNVPARECYQVKGNLTIGGLAVDLDQTGYLFPVAAHETKTLTPAVSRIIAVIQSQLGIQSDANNGTLYSDWYQANYPKAGNDFRGEDWCAMFVSWCLHQAGVGLQFAWVPTGVDAFRAYNLLDQNPTPGAVVFYDWNHDGVGTHTGFVESVDAAGVHTIEGNAGTPIRCLPPPDRADRRPQHGRRDRLRPPGVPGMNPLAVTGSGGPSVIVSGWVAIIVIIGGIAAAVFATVRVLWPLLQATVAIAEQMPFFRQAEAKHEALEARVDNHETRITALESTRR